MKAGWAAAGLVSLAGISACMAAPDASPRTRPSRDVVATYSVSGEATSLVPGGLNGPVRLSWDAAGQRVRAEAEGRSQVALLELGGRTGTVFDTNLRIVLPLKTKDLGPLTLDGARLTPQGRDTVAGLGCTEYGFETRDGPGQVCLTADGVPLRGQGTIQGKPGRFTALTVRYGRVPAELFGVPPGYISLGGGSGGAGGGAGGLGGLAERLGGSGVDLRGLLGRVR